MGGANQASAVIMLVVWWAIEFPNRGIILDYPKSNRCCLGDSCPNICFHEWLFEYIRKYHGYYLYWAVIYTFWYHPFESTFGHFMGFSNTALLMAQGSFVFTKGHVNKYWRYLLETWILMHSVIVAIGQYYGDTEAQLWPMFGFGFLFTTMFTASLNLPCVQMCTRNERFGWIGYWAIVVAFIGIVALFACGIPSIYIEQYCREAPHIWTRIPSILYLQFVFMMFLIWLFDRFGCTTVKEPITNLPIGFAIMLILNFAMAIIPHWIGPIAQLNLLLVSAFCQMVFLTSFVLLAVFWLEPDLQRIAKTTPRKSVEELRTTGEDSILLQI